jgi:ubiquinone/menaquinone biosynthesis C-methylase UbiE
METGSNCNTLVSHHEVKSIMQNERWNSPNAKAYNRYRRISRRRNWLKLLSNELASVPTGETVLEVGAGTGLITEVLAEAGYKVLATDLSSSMLSLAATNIDSAGFADRVDFHEMDAESLTTGDNAFAAVVSRWVLWTLPRPYLALAEMARSLRPGGRLVLIDGQQRDIGLCARYRSMLVDMLLAGRLPGWHSKSFRAVSKTLPRIDAPETASILAELGFENIKSRWLTDTEGDGFLRNWFMGRAWQSNLVTGDKLR